MMDFLYFPDNKLEYLPSIALLIVTLAAAMYTMMFILKVSKKQERKAKELEQQILANLQATEEEANSRTQQPAPK